MDPSPVWITTGSDGALWFTIFGNATVPSAIGRITTSGAITIYRDPMITGPQGIAAGSDGALWFIDSAGLGSIGRITTSGVVSNFTDPKMSIAGPLRIAAGSPTRRAATSAATRSGG